MSWQSNLSSKWRPTQSSGSGGSSRPSLSTKNIFRVSPEEAVRVADVAEHLVPGGSDFVRYMFQARRDFIKGVSSLLDAQVHEHDKIDEMLRDDDREPWTGDIVSGVTEYPSQRVQAIQNAAASAERATLDGAIGWVETAVGSTVGALSGAASSVMGEMSGASGSASAEAPPTNGKITIA